MFEHKDGLWRRFIGSPGHSATAKRKTLANKTLSIYQKHREQEPISPRYSQFDSRQIQEELLEITGEHKALNPVLEKPKSIAKALGITGRCLDTHHRTARADHRKGLNRWFGQGDNGYEEYLQERINTISQVPFVDEQCIGELNNIDLTVQPEQEINDSPRLTNAVIFETPSAPLMELVSDIPELVDLLARLQMLEGVIHQETSPPESIEQEQEAAPEAHTAGLHLVEGTPLPARKQNKLTHKQRTKLKQQQKQEKALSAV